MPSQCSVPPELYAGILLIVHLHVDSAQQGRKLLQGTLLHAE